MIDVKKEIFRWGPIPGRFYWLSEFIDVGFQAFAQKYDGNRWPENYLLFRDSKMVWINQMETLRSKGQEIFLKYVLNKQQRKKSQLDWKQKTELLLKKQKEIDFLDLKKLSDEQLKEIHHQLFERVIEFWMDTMPAELGNYGSESVLKSELIKYLPEKEINSALEILSAPEKLSFYKEEEIALAETKDISKHQKNYFWLQNSYAGVKTLNEEYFIERKKKLNPKLRSEAFSRLEKVKEQKKELIQKYKLPASLINIARAISEGIELQDSRKRYVFHNLYYKDLFIKELSRRKNYPYEDLLNAWHYEIEDILSGKDLKAELSRRRNGFGVHTIEKGTNLSSEETIHYWEEFVYEKTVRDINQFSGIVASKGNESFIQGKVRIVLDPFQAKNFQKGEILIAPMTSPEYVFLMEKAAAIITDTGGLTCHAAIVSREFEIPCIVGTKIATQILKDGDVVKIDAAKGTVKIVKKAK